MVFDDSPVKWVIDINRKESQFSEQFADLNSGLCIYYIYMLRMSINHVSLDSNKWTIDFVPMSLFWPTEGRATARSTSLSFQIVEDFFLVRIQAKTHGASCGALMLQYPFPRKASTKNKDIYQQYRRSLYFADHKQPFLV